MQTGDDDHLQRADRLLAALSGLLVAAADQPDDEHLTLTPEEVAGIREILQMVRHLLRSARAVSPAG